MLNIGCNTSGSLLVYKIFLENPPSGASYFFNNNNVLDGEHKIMQENPPLGASYFLHIVNACGDGFPVQLGNGGGGGGGGGDGQGIFLCIKNCWKLMHNTLDTRVVGPRNI